MNDLLSGFAILFVLAALTLLLTPVGWRCD